MNYYFAYGLTLATEIDFPELFVVNPTDKPEVNVCIGKVPSHLSRQTEEQLKNLFITSTEYFLCVKDIAFYYAANGNQVIIEPFPDADKKSVRLFFLSNAMAAILYQRELIPLHASAIFSNKGIAMFLGDSGVGKSTTVATLQTRGHRIFSDDICVPVKEDKIIKAFAAYPMMKLWKDTFEKVNLGEYDEQNRIRPALEKYGKFFNETFDTTAHPVERIFILEKDSSLNQLQSSELKGINAFKYLQHYAYRLPYIDAMGMRKTYFNILLDLSNSIPITLISRPEDSNTISEVIQLIENQLA
jgi:hypothetical protein